ncbi:MAG: hypothetical protein Ct9H300mP1_29980 [Planctomycetaceae bacterium]|nr:MAG: hypothetical protein Ct9H300mP1_29980 [Planctomycetaceae bacterium]
MRRPVVRGGAVSLVVAGLILGCGLASFGQEQSDGWRPRKTARDGLNRNVAPWARPSIRGGTTGITLAVVRCQVAIRGTCVAREHGVGITCLAGHG